MKFKTVSGQTSLNGATARPHDESTPMSCTSLLQGRLQATAAPPLEFKRRSLERALWLENQCRPVWVNSLQSPTNAQPGFLRQPSFKEFSVPGYEFQSLCYDGHLDKALGVLCNMGQEGIVPPEEMYVTLLEACTRKKALAQAKRVHAHLRKHGYESSTSLGVCVVSTLVKCGGLEDALQVFRTLLHKSVISWTALISGYVQTGQYYEAVRMYRRMIDEGVHPNKYTFVSLLKACGRASNLLEGKRIHGEALKFGCESDLVVGTCLVDMYAKCGSIMDAQIVFDGLPVHDMVSCSVMLGAFVEQGESEKAFHLYRDMQEKGVAMDARTFISVIQACGILAEYENTALLNGQSLKMASFYKTKEIHSEVQTRGYESDVFVGSTLISVYARCGSLGDAKDVFDRLDPNVVSWNALVAGYAHYGQGVNALQLYQQMQEEGLVPDDRTFVSTLQACGSLIASKSVVFGDGQFLCLESLQIGKVIHAEACRMGCVSDPFVGSSLISTYARCGSMADAHDVFKRMSKQDVVSWNAMLAGYAQQCQGEMALQLYYKMQENGVAQNDRTFASTLQACSGLAEEEDSVLVDAQMLRVESLQKGKVIHGEARRMGYTDDVFVGSTLVSMYAKCGSLLDAEKAFGGLLRRNVVCWNSILAGYVLHGQAHEALQVYEEMLKDGVAAGAWTFASAVQGCGTYAESEEAVVVGHQSIKLESLKRGREIHAEAQKKGYALDASVGNALLIMYRKCGSNVDAHCMFDRLLQPNVVSWSTMLLAYAEQGQGVKSLELYWQMLDEGISPDAWALGSVLQACCSHAEREPDVLVEGQSISLECLQKVKAIHSAAQLRGHQSDIFLGSTLIAMYGKFGSVIDAQIVFDGLPQQNVVSWTSMLMAYVQQGQWKRVLQLYSQMLDEGVQPDDATFVCILQACGNTGALDTCVEIHKRLVLQGCKLNALVATTLIHAYGRCASMVDAQSVFDAIPLPDVVAWNAIIAGHARQGDSAACLQGYEKMQVAGVKPNEVTFVSLLSACSHCGWVGKALECFESMSRDHGISPEIEHYTCMVDLLGRTGCFDAVEELLSKMPMQANLSMWLCLLAGCRSHGNVRIAKHAFDRAVLVQPKCSAAYILMSTIYAQAGMWDCAKLVDDSRQNAGALKQPGQSWTQNWQEVETFLVGESTQQNEGEAFHLLHKLSTEIQCRW